MTNPESPRMFLQSLSSTELEDALELSRKTTVESGKVVDGDRLGIISNHLTELMRDYPQFVYLAYFVSLDAKRADPHNRDEQLIATGIERGIAIAARAITLAAEAREMPEL